MSIGTKVVADRWNLLIVRELLQGATRFNEIHRALPGLSRSLLTGRLQHLIHHDLVVRAAPDADAPGYHLTPAGTAMWPIIKAIGEWSVAWRFPDPTGTEPDPSLLYWRLYQAVRIDATPDRRVTIEIFLSDASTDTRRGWLILDRPDSTLCVEPPRHDVDLRVSTTIATWQSVWFGHRRYNDALRTGDLTLDGPRELVSDFPRWFDISPFAPTVEADARTRHPH